MLRIGISDCNYERYTNRAHGKQDTGRLRQYDITWLTITSKEVHEKWIHSLQTCFPVHFLVYFLLFALSGACLACPRFPFQHQPSLCILTHILFSFYIQTLSSHAHLHWKYNVRYASPQPSQYASLSGQFGEKCGNLSSNEGGKAEAISRFDTQKKCLV